MKLLKNKRNRMKKDENIKDIRLLVYKIRKQGVLKITKTSRNKLKSMSRFSRNKVKILQNELSRRNIIYFNKGFWFSKKVKSV